MKVIRVAAAAALLGIAAACHESPTMAKPEQRTAPAARFDENGMGMGGGNRTDCSTTTPCP
jgi:hypothetical protein